MEFYPEGIIKLQMEDEDGRKVYKEIRSGVTQEVLNEFLENFTESELNEFIGEKNYKNYLEHSEQFQRELRLKRACHEAIFNTHMLFKVYHGPNNRHKINLDLILYEAESLMNNINSDGNYFPEDIDTICGELEGLSRVNNLIMRILK